MSTDILLALKDKKGLLKKNPYGINLYLYEFFLILGVRSFRISDFRRSDSLLYIRPITGSTPISSNV